MRRAPGARDAGGVSSDARSSSPSATPTASSCLCRLADAAEILVRDPGGGPVSALGWDATGARLLFGLETGAAGVLNLPG